MKKNLSRTFYSFSLMVLMMTTVVACQNNNKKDENNQEIQYARLSYDRCLQINHYEMCNSVRTGSVLSLKEYHGMSTNYGNPMPYTQQNYNYGNTYGNNNYYAYGRTNNFVNNYNPAYTNGYYGNSYGTSYPYLTQYSATQIDEYFNNYLRRATKEEVLDMAGRWNSGNTTYQQNSPYYRSCGPQGCY